MKIAVLKATQAQADVVCRTLSAAGHTCHAFDDIQALFGQLRSQPFDLLVLDRHAPGLRGDEVLRLLRQNLAERPHVLFTTNSGDTWNHAATDWLVEPLSAGAPLARVEMLLRSQNPSEPVAEREVFGDYEFEPDSERVFVRGNAVTLTHKEFELALLLFKQMSQPLSRTHILDAIWKQGPDISSRSMDTHVSMVRTKLGLRPENGYRLMPIYGYGYRLDRIG
ncbi:response regulator transcription factor [Paraburkholderia sp. Ac-20340]|uniref:response regulator transcription factor n=1 Tax=Paraburkholderia sp. Ac-20340 TaxID=2703888 RepID=UPI00197DFD78|nr:response regulator transcription factor [Paraburkholderia sp. Ac-20340]MBN3856680.1 response regulator transcription factor [Paraburkholderia sp. Ac-20340]